MTAGNQGPAYDAAQAALKANPNDRAIQTEAARTKAILNASLAAQNQKTK